MKNNPTLSMRTLGRSMATAALLAPSAALAASGSVRTPDKLLNTGFTNVSDAIAKIFNISITVAGVIFVLLFLFGGIQYLAAAGNEENTNKAKKLLVDALVGLVIVVVSWAVGTYVLQLLGIGSEGQLDLQIN